MKLTKVQFLKELRDSLTEGEAMCGSYDPVIMDELRALRERITAVVIAYMSRVVPADSIKNDTVLQKAWEAYQENLEIPADEANAIRGLGRGEQ